MQLLSSSVRTCHQHHSCNQHRMGEKLKSLFPYYYETFTLCVFIHSCSPLLHETQTDKVENAFFDAGRGTKNLINYECVCYSLQLAFDIKAERI